MKLDVFTLFPEHFEWFLRQRHVANALAQGNELAFYNYRETTPLSAGQVDERELDRIEAIILSMTPFERAHPTEINGSRRKRIATGSGTTVQAVNRRVKQFGQMNKLMTQLSAGKMPDPQQRMRGMR